MERGLKYEVRLGNWLQYEGKPIQIECLDIDIYEQDYPTSGLEPIPLKEEWLLRISKYVKWDAFGNHNWGGYINFVGDWKLMIRFWKGNFIYEIVTVNKKSGYYKGVMKIKLKIEYLHQLQNLYFALTREELTFKTEEL